MLTPAEKGKLRNLERFLARPLDGQGNFLDGLQGMLKELQHEKNLLLEKENLSRLRDEKSQFAVKELAADVVVLKRSVERLQKQEMTPARVTPSEVWDGYEKKEGPSTKMWVDTKGVAEISDDILASCNGVLARAKAGGFTSEIAFQGAFMEVLPLVSSGCAVEDVHSRAVILKNRKPDAVVYATNKALRYAAFVNCFFEFKMPGNDDFTPDALGQLLDYLLVAQRDGRKVPRGVLFNGSHLTYMELESPDRGGLRWHVVRLGQGEGSFKFDKEQLQVLRSFLTVPPLLCEIDEVEIGGENYYLSAFLGAGTSAEIFRVSNIDGKTGDGVLKVCKKAVDGVQRKMMINEVDVYAKLCGIRGTLGVLAHGDVTLRGEERYAILFNYVLERVSLRRLPSRGDVVGFFRSLEEIHRRGYVHRDVNPNNLGVNVEAPERDKSEGNGYVIDLGCAVPADAETPYLGTLDYASRGVRTELKSALGATCVFPTSEGGGYPKITVTRKDDVESLVLSLYALQCRALLPYDENWGNSQHLRALDEFWNQREENGPLLKHLLNMVDELFADTNTASQPVTYTELGKYVADTYYDDFPSDTSNSYSTNRESPDAADFEGIGETWQPSESPTSGGVDLMQTPTKTSRPTSGGSGNGELNGK